MNIAQTQTFRLKESTDSHLRFRALSTHVSYSSYEKTFAHTLLKKYAISNTLILRFTRTIRPMVLFLREHDENGVCQNSR